MHANILVAVIITGRSNRIRVVGVTKGGRWGAVRRRRYSRDKWLDRMSECMKINDEQLANKWPYLVLSAPSPSWLRSSPG